MRQPMRRRLLTALMAAGLVGGMVLSSPSALGQPDVPPPPAPVDPAVALAPPPVDPAAPRSRRRPIRWRRHRRLRPRSGSRRRRRLPIRWPRRRRPSLAARRARPQPMAIPEGTPAGQNPTPYVGRAGRSRRRRSIRPTAPRPAPPSRSTSTSSGRSPTGRWPSRRSTSRRSRRCPAGSTGPATPRCAGGRRTSGRPGTVVNIDAGGTKSSFTVPEQLVATIDNATHQMEIMRNGKLEKTFPVSMGKKGLRHQERHVLRAGEVRRHRDGLLDVRRACQFGQWLQAQGPGRRAHR